MNIHLESFGKNVDYSGLVRAANHYKGETNYCSVVALAVVTGCKFGKARSIMAKAVDRKTGKGTSRRAVHKFVYEAMGVDLIPMQCSGFMIKNSADRLPKIGSFLVYSSGHVTAVKNGVIHDWCVLNGAKGKRMTEVYRVA